MKIALDIVVDNKLSDNDIIVYKKGKWRAVLKDDFLGNMAKKDNELENQIKDLQSQIDELKATLIELAKIVKEK